jgi:hypothetical protein
MTRVTESFATGPEAKGIYPSPNIASYLRYHCAYCERKFFMVSPITFLAGGAIMREQYRNCNEIATSLQLLSLLLAFTNVYPHLFYLKVT